MIDTHCHILWGVDDASQCERQSLDMLHIAQNDGVKEIIATPHIKMGLFENTYEQLHQAYIQLLKTIQKHNIQVKVYLGAENYVSKKSMHLLKEKKFVPLVNSNYILIEFAWTKNIHDNPTLYIKQFIEAGYRPIIAHPERYEWVHEDYSLLKTWKELGCLLQVNRTSILSLDSMKKANTYAQKMLADGFVDIIASDAHHAYAPRFIKLSDVYTFVCTHYSESLAKKCLIDTPKMIINAGKENTNDPSQ